MSRSKLFWCRKGESPHLLSESTTIEQLQELPGATYLVDKDGLIQKVLTCNDEEGFSAITDLISKVWNPNLKAALLDQLEAALQGM